MLCPSAVFRLQAAETVNDLEGQLATSSGALHEAQQLLDLRQAEVVQLRGAVKELNRVRAEHVALQEEFAVCDCARLETARALTKLTGRVKSLFAAVSSGAGMLCESRVASDGIS